MFTWCPSKHSCWLSPSFLRIRSGSPLSGSLTGAWPLHGPAACRTRPLSCGQASANAGLPPGAPIGVCPVVRAFAGPRRVSDTSTSLGRGYKRPLRRWLSSVWGSDCRVSGAALSPSLLSFGKSCFPGPFGLAPSGSSDLFPGSPVGALRLFGF